MKLHSRDRPYVRGNIMAKEKINQIYKKENFGGNNIMLKKTISIVLVVVTLFSIFAVTASAASYKTGQYQVAANSGVNVRPSINSSSRYGAASKGTTFKVTQVSGNWGYTPSIYCANGKTVSGWICLDYCSYKGSGHTHNYNGGRYYQNAHPHEISVRCTNYNSCGGWKWTGECYKVSGCSQCYPSTTTYYTLSFNANGGSNTPASQRVKAGTYFNITSAKPTRSGYTFLGWSTSKTATSASYYPNTCVRLNGNATLYAVWKKNATAAVKLNVPSYKQGDSRWKNVYIGTKTIGQVGCTTTSIAMVYSYNTNSTVYPHQVMKKLSYSNNDLYWSSISNVGLTSKAYNCSLTNSMLSTIYSKLKQGRPVIIGAKSSSGSYQHWVVITGYTGTSTTNFNTADFTINDPGSQGCKTLKAFLANGDKADRTQIIRIMY